MLRDDPVGRQGVALERRGYSLRTLPASIDGNLAGERADVVLELDEALLGDDPGSWRRAGQCVKPSALGDEYRNAYV